MAKKCFPKLFSSYCAIDSVHFYRFLIHTLPLKRLFLEIASEFIYKAGILIESTQLQLCIVKSAEEQSSTYA